jgi:ribosomal protein S6
MKNYELTYLISPNLSEKEVLIFQEKIISLIQEGGGTLDEVKTPVRKKGIYLATLNFHLDSGKLGNLEKKLKADGQVLRYIILTKKLPKKVPEKKPEITIKPKKIVKPKAKVELKEIEKKLEEILDESK